MSPGPTYSGRIAAAVFDLGKVVIDVRPEQIVRCWARCSGAAEEEIAAVLRADRDYQRMERGELSMHEYYALLSPRLPRPIGFSDFVAGWNSIFFGLVCGIERLLDHLAAGGVRLVALSNTNEAHARRWRELYGDALRRFERIFLSHELGTRKPEPQCYRRVIDYLGLPAGRIAFVDDKAENVAAARQAGMQGVVATTPGETARALAKCKGSPLGGGPGGPGGKQRGYIT